MEGNERGSKMEEERDRSMKATKINRSNIITYFHSINNQSVMLVIDNKLNDNSHLILNNTVFVFL